MIFKKSNFSNYSYSSELHTYSVNSTRSVSNNPLTTKLDMPSHYTTENIIITIDNLF